MTQGDKQEAAHHAWRLYRDEVTSDGRKDRRSLRAREFFAGFQKGREYQLRVQQANEQLLNLVTWIRQHPDQWEHFKVAHEETFHALRDLLLSKNERKTHVSSD